MTELATELQALGLPPPPAASYGREQAVLNWSDQGVLLAEFARQRGLVIEHWLQDAAVQPGGPLSPAQLLALLAPLLRLGSDAPFVLGQLWWPGHYGLASQALRQSAHALQAAERLARYAGRLSPLLTPRVMQQGGRLWLLFTEACGLPAAQRAALVDLHLAAFVGFCHWRGGQRLPWRAHFNRSRPRDPGAQLVWLGPELQFDCQIDALSLPLECALKPWAAEGGAELALAALEAGADAQALRRGWLAGLGEQMLAQLCAGAPSLEALARSQGVSPATLKRQLAAQGTHYQAELDQLRALLAAALMKLLGWSPERVGAALGFGDASNFRKSFRRWTGLSPRAWA